MNAKNLNTPPVPNPAPQSDSQQYDSFFVPLSIINHSSNYNLQKVAPFQKEEFIKNHYILLKDFDTQLWKDKITGKHTEDIAFWERVTGSGINICHCYLDEKDQHTPAHLEILTNLQSTYERCWSDTDFIKLQVDLDQIILLKSYYAGHLITKWFKIDLKDRNKLDILNIHYNNPYDRQLIRKFNRELVATRNTDPSNFLKIKKWMFLLEDIDTFWITKIKASSFLFYTYNALRLCRNLLDFGLIDFNSELYEEFCHRLQTIGSTLLEMITYFKSYCEDRNHQFEKNKTPKTNSKYIAFEYETEIFNMLIPKCKKVLGNILIHLITDFYDRKFCQTFTDAYITGADTAMDFDFKNHEVLHKTEKMVLELFPFYDKTISETIIKIFFNFLLEFSDVGSIRPQNQDYHTRNVLETLISYVITSESDVFIKSLKMTTPLDLKYFSLGIRDNHHSKDKSLLIRNVFEYMIECVKDGSYGNDGIQDSSKQPFGNGENSLWTSRINHQEDFQSFKNERNIFNILKIIRSIVKKSADTKHHDEVEFRRYLALENIPVCVMVLYAELQGSMSVSNSSKEQAEGNYIEIIEFLYELCENNNLAKASIFKASGMRSLTKILANFDVNFALFLLKISDEPNIGGYITQQIYIDILYIYKLAFQDIIRDFKDNKTSTSDNPNMGFNNSSINKKYMFLIIMNRFWCNFFDKKHINPREKANKTLQLQEFIYKDICSTLVPKALELLQEGLSNDYKNYVIDSDQFNYGNEFKLFENLHKAKFDQNQNIYLCKQLQLNIAISTFAIMTKISKEYYSKHIWRTMEKSCQKIDEYVDANLFQKKISFEDLERHYDLIKMAVNFQVIPKNKLLLNCPNENEIIPGAQESTKLINKYIDMTNWLIQNSDTDNYVGFMLQVLIPILTKLYYSFQNHSEFHTKSKLIDMIKVVNDMTTRIDSKINIPLKKLFVGDEIAAIYQQVDFELIDFHKGDKKIHLLQKLTKHIMKILYVFHGYVEIFPKFISEKNTFFFNRNYSAELIQTNQVVSYELVIQFQDNSIFNDKITGFEIAQNHHLEYKKKLLNKFISLYNRGKSEFIQNNDMKYGSLMKLMAPHKSSAKAQFTIVASSIFEKYAESKQHRQKKTTDIMVNGENKLQIDDDDQFENMALTNSELLRPYQQKKQIDTSEADEEYQSVQEESVQLNYWLNFHTHSQIKLLTMLMNDYTIANDYLAWVQKDEPFAIPDQSDPFQVKIYNSIKNSMGATHNFKQVFISIQLKISSDMISYQMSTESCNGTWWMVYYSYDEINQFFEALVCNEENLDMKTYYSNLVPCIPFIPNFNQENLSIFGIKIRELKMVLNSSSIYKNSASKFELCDRPDIVVPCLKSIIVCLDAWIRRSYEPNIKLIQTVVPNLHRYISKIILRIIDDINDEFYNLKQEFLLFVVHLSEKNTYEIQADLANELSVSKLEWINRHIVKKTYIREKIRESLTEERALKFTWEELIEPESSKSRFSFTKLVKEECLFNHKKILRNQSYNVNYHKIEPNDKSKLLKIGQYRKGDDYYYIHWIPSDLDNDYAVNNLDQLINFRIGSNLFNQMNLEKITFVVNRLNHNMTKVSEVYFKRYKEINKQISKKIKTRNFQASWSKSHQILHHVDHKFVDKLRKTNNSAVERNEENDTLDIYLLWNSDVIEVVSTIEKKNMLISFKRNVETILVSEVLKRHVRDGFDISGPGEKLKGLIDVYKFFSLSMKVDMHLYRKLGSFLYNLTSREMYKTWLKIMLILGFIINLNAQFNVRLYGDTEIGHSDGIFRYIGLILPIVVIVIALPLLISIFVFRFQSIRVGEKQKWEARNPTGNSESPISKMKIFFMSLSDQAITACLFHQFSNSLGLKWDIFLPFQMGMVYNFNFHFRGLIIATKKALYYILTTYIVQQLLCVTFALYIMTWFQNQQWDAGFQDIDCTNGWPCLGYTYYFSEGMDSGMQGALKEYPETSPDRHAWRDATVWMRVIFDTLNWFLIKSIFGNIVGSAAQIGLTQINGHEVATEYDETQVCFICGLTRDQFKRSNKDFDNHVNDEHSLWKYIYYLFYLENSTEEDLRDIDKEIYEKFKKGDISWIPQGETLYVEVDDVLDAEEKKKADDIYDIVMEKLQKNDANLQAMFKKFEICDQSSKRKKFWAEHLASYHKNNR